MNRTLLRNLFFSSKELLNYFYLAEFLTQKRGIEGYENMSNDELSHALRTSKNENYVRIEKIREEIKKLPHRLSRQELKEIKKNLYEIENKKSRLESKKTKKYLNKLEERIHKLNTYYDYDDAKYRGIKDKRYV